MSYTYITTGATTQIKTGRVYKLKIQVNAALTGTITVIDGTTGTTGNVAIITNPTVGSSYEYWDLQNGARVVTSTTCDVTVNAESNIRPS